MATMATSVDSVQTRSRNKRRLKRNLDTSTGELIIDEAERIIAKHGVDGLRLVDIAKSLGVSQPGIYTHYKNGRNEILANVGIRAIDGLADHFEDDGRSDPEKILERDIRRLVVYWVENPSHLRLLIRDFASPDGLPLFNELAGGPPGTLEKSGKWKPMRERLKGILDRGYRMGKFRRVDSGEFFNLVMGITLMDLVHPFYRSSKKIPKKKLIEKLQSRLIDVALRVVRKDLRPGGSQSS